MLPLNIITIHRELSASFPHSDLPSGHVVISVQTEDKSNTRVSRNIWDAVSATFREAMAALLDVVASDTESLSREVWTLTDGVCSAENTFRPAGCREDAPEEEAGGEISSWDELLYRGGKTLLVKIR